MEGFYTAAAAAKGEYSEKRSDFIANIFPCTDENSAKALIDEIRTLHRDARHNVYAYSLREGDIKRFSDDGEPHGTGGKPVLEVIEGNSLTNVLVVVTRYFGGILLGPGGLARAYGAAAKSAVGNAQIVEMRLCTLFETKCPYPDYKRLTGLIHDFSGTVGETVFEENVIVSYRIEKHLVKRFLEQLTELFAATLTAKETGEELAAVSESM